MKTKSKRLANIELLRIIAMCMVITLHYLGKSKLLQSVFSDMNAMGYVAWILESLSIVAVNVYVLISGYFLVESEFKPQKVVRLVLQVLFYTVLITTLSLAFGIIKTEDLGFYNLIVQLFPFQMEQYWFMTSYLVLYILAPVLAMGVKSLSKKHLQIVTIMFVCFMCVEKSILPVQIAFDERGYDPLWFICLFLVAAYIRLYGLKLLERPGFALMVYFAGCALAFAENRVFAFAYNKIGELGHLVGSPYHYNHFFVFTASVGLFCFFLKVKIKEGKIADLICKISPYTLGVYLLHEHFYIKYLWQDLFGASKVNGAVGLLFTTLAAVITVFSVGIVTDWLRSLLFKACGKLFLRRPKTEERIG